MGTLKWEAFEAGPDIVAGTVDSERGIQLRSHVVKVADCSVDVNYPIRAASGHVNVNVNEQFLSPRESCNIVTTAAP